MNDQGLDYGTLARASYDLFRRRLLPVYFIAFVSSALYGPIAVFTYSLSQAFSDLTVANIVYRFGASLLADVFGAIADILIVTLLLRAVGEHIGERPGSAVRRHFWVVFMATVPFSAVYDTLWLLPGSIVVLASLAVMVLTSGWSFVTVIRVTEELPFVDCFRKSFRLARPFLKPLAAIWLVVGIAQWLLVYGVYPEMFDREAAIGLLTYWVELPIAQAFAWSITAPIVVVVFLALRQAERQRTADLFD